MLPAKTASERGERGSMAKTQTAPEVIFDKRDQLLKIEAALIEGETLYAVYDLQGAGTGFIGITSKRIIYYDKQFLRKIKAVVSIPYSRIIAVGTHDESGLLTGRGFFSSSTLILTTAHGETLFHFRGADKAYQAHYLIIQHMCPD